MFGVSVKSLLISMAAALVVVAINNRFPIPMVATVDMKKAYDAKVANR